MKSLSEWIQDEIAWDEKALSGRVETQFDRDRIVGGIAALKRVLKELKAREDAERERVNENVNALDGYVAEVLEEKEGGTG